MPTAKARRSSTPAAVEAGAVPAESLGSRFPAIALPIVPPYEPLEATSVDELPEGGTWQYEPKWDGFRGLAFKHDDQVLLQSKSGQRLDRYFPELVRALQAVNLTSVVFDGEIVIEADGELSFDDLLQRIHPAESRVRTLASATPSSLLVFDLLVGERGRDLTSLPLAERREHLERLFARLDGRGVGLRDRVRLSPASTDLAVARRWMRSLVGNGLDGVVAKRRDARYVPGDRSSMVKVKPVRTADCVVGAFRYDQSGQRVASLLLGLYDDAGLLHHIGFSASFTSAARASLKAVVEPLRSGPGFTGRAPGGPSRWSRRASNPWEPLRPELVCEVEYDHFSGGRFRHGATFLRWRPDKRPTACTFAQVRGSAWSGGLERLLDAVARD